ncbi:hypothetical protein NDU88_004275 [Pleurodeles waltl]|uniref:Uncharacterized protein n=1 Tax=Pleurodeles waltl TaxID=8319 RepID=A0AAV7QC43_PLEWA|nr:hypothetical protein NDU88_004275 [Pleurodeles waltl]
MFSIRFPTLTEAEDHQLCDLMDLGNHSPKSTDTVCPTPTPASGSPTSVNYTVGLGSGLRLSLLPDSHYPRRPAQGNDDFSSPGHEILPAPASAAFTRPGAGDLQRRAQIPQKVHRNSSARPD